MLAWYSSFLLEGAGAWVSVFDVGDVGGGEIFQILKKSPADVVDSVDVLDTIEILLLNVLENQVKFATSAYLNEQKGIYCPTQGMPHNF